MHPVLFRKLLAILFVVTALFSSCDNDPRNRTHATVPLSSINKGKALAATYCGSCHLLPDPSLLDAKTWEKGVLPQMGPRLGIFKHLARYYPTYRNDPNLPKDYYPSSAALKEEEWQNIVDYYSATSPDSLGGQRRNQKIKSTLSLFQAQPNKNNYSNSGTSLIKLASGKMPYAMAMSDAFRQTTYFFDKTLAVVDSVVNSGAVVDVDFSQGGLLACNIGQLNPTNGRYGKADLYSITKGRLDKRPQTLFDDLQRPVQLTAADFNGDGKTDYLVCEFGFLSGALSWMEGTDDGHFIRHVVRQVPGAIKAYVDDWNGDGKPDFTVMFAQGDEGIFLFLNKGGGEFDAQPLLRFPPSYGSSFFELADFNKDGHPDIVYTCGDNTDYSIVLKPYHGVYIYLNDGHNRFTPQYFFPINGCYKALARDFDGDGDLDLATISFFADYVRQPEEGFVYLQNAGKFQFTPFSLPEATAGRWLTMDAGDLDGDGHIDLVLGNFFLGPDPVHSKKDWSKAPPFLWLKNTGRK